MLHFPVYVNDREIGWVMIRRLNRVVKKGVPSKYEYEVQEDNSRGKGTVLHFQEDGALILIQKVLADATGMV